MKYLISFLLFPLYLLASTKVAIIGDSISIGAGASEGHGYVDLLIKRYKEEGKDVEIINRSLGGSYTDIALNVGLTTLTMDRPDYIIFFLGINDCMRAKVLGWTPDQLKQNILNNFDEIFRLCSGNCKKSILGGITCSFQPEYNRSLFEVYQTLIKRYKCYPVSLLGSDVIPHTIDGFHPNDKGSEMIADKLYVLFHDLGIY